MPRFDVRINCSAILFACLACTGCIVHRPALQTWRLVKRDTDQVLIPPDVSSPDLTRRTIKADVIPDHASCSRDSEAVNVRVRGKRARVTVTRDSLAEQPRGWLHAWAFQLEEQHCLAPGEGLKLAVRIAESVPLAPSAAFRLLYSDENQTGEVDVGRYSRLQVVSPVWRQPGMGLMAEGPYTVTGSGYSLHVTGKSTENLLGYETALYAVQPKVRGIGYMIAPLYAELRIQEKSEHKPQPFINYFQLPADAAFYRMFYKSGQNDYTALIVAARTPAELEQRTRILDASGASASCAKLNGEMCITIPKAVAVNALISVSVNGAEVLVQQGGTVFQAIWRAGERQPKAILPQLKIYKPWNGRLMAVSFDPADTAILQLTLRGGEIISWK